MLPLLYLSHKLTVRDDPSYFSTWNIMLRPGRSMANCAQCHGGDGSNTLLQRFEGLRDNICAPVRIFRTLYALGRVIGEDPNSLQPTPSSLLNIGPDSAIDVQSVDESTSKALGSEPTDPSAKAPASASQIYHAALLNGNTLDDILAAFETTTPGSSILAEQPVVAQSPPISDDNDDRLTGPFKRHHYRNSSVRSKPQEATFAHILNNTTSCSPDTSQASCEGHAKRPDESLCLSPITRGHAHSASSPRGYDLFKEQVEHNRAAWTEVGPCPTYMRRHNHSAIPKRPLSGDRKSLALLQETGTVSSPTLSSSSPTKRARLQRRVKVYQDEERV